MYTKEIKFSGSLRKAVMFYECHPSLSVGKHTKASKEEQAQKKMLGIYEVLWYLC